MTQDEKDEELYKASLSAFFQNELEHDKIILGLSTAGIGFFIAIFQTQEGKISEVMFIASILSLIMFAIISSIIFTLSLIFQSINKENIQMKDTTKSSLTRDSNKSQVTYTKRGFSEVSTANSSEANTSNPTTSQADQNDSNASSSSLDNKQ